MNILRNPIVLVIVALVVFGWYQDRKIDQLIGVSEQRLSDIVKLESSLKTANGNLETLAERMSIQAELMDESIAANKVLDNEYKDYIDSKFTDSGGMLLNIQRTVRNLSTATATSGTPSNGSAEPIYIELPPEMGRAILRLLRDADDDRLEAIEWKRWYCKHNPEHQKCGEWFP